MTPTPRRFLAVAILLASCTYGGAGADADDGWRRAVEKLAPSDPIIPTEMVLFQDGRIEGTQTPCRNDAVLRLRCIADDGSPVWDVVKTTGVGGTNPDPDILCVSPLARVKKGGQISIATTGVTPLSPGEQRRVRAKDTGETRTIDGRPCRVHAFEWRRTFPERGRESGTACLDEETDLPVVVEIEPRDPPKGIRRVRHVTHYGPVLEGRWAIVRAEIDFWLEDTGGEDPTTRIDVQMSGHATATDLDRPGACES